MANAQIQQFIVRLEIPQTGPRGGYRDPIVRTYAVCAHTNEEAIAVFREEMNVPEGATVRAVSTRSRVISVRAA